MTDADDALIIGSGFLFCPETVEVKAHGEQAAKTLQASRMPGADP